MQLVRFSRALEGHKDDLGYNQFWRYKSGRLPKVLRWVAAHPELARALADDAAELAGRDEGIVPDVDTERG